MGTPCVQKDKAVMPGDNLIDNWQRDQSLIR
jgi:hypothetical protein